MRVLSASTTKVARPSLPTTAAGAKAVMSVVKAVPACQASQGPSLPSQGPVTTPRVKPKLLPAATNTVLDKAIGRVMPVRDTLSIPSQSAASAGHLASLAQATSSVRSRP